MSKHHEKQTSNTTTWLTPLWIIQALGEFDLDPCGHEQHKTANKILCQPEHDGLTVPWHGRVWLNPPYGPGIHDWLIRLWAAGHGTALVPARTETKWFQAAIHQCSAALFLEKRISFLQPSPAGEDWAPTPVDGNTVGSVLIAYGIYDCERLRRSGLAGWAVVQ